MDVCPDIINASKEFWNEDYVNNESVVIQCCEIQLIFCLIFIFHVI